MHAFNIQDNWYQSNRKYLLSVMESLFYHLQTYVETEEENYDGNPAIHPVGDHTESITQSLFKTWDTNLTQPPALEQLCQRFGLSNFEKDILLLCAGVEVDARLQSLCAEANGNHHVHHPTFGLALSLFPAPHWSALTPNGPLRAWQLIHLAPGKTLVDRAISIDERILHYLIGVPSMDPLLPGLSSCPALMQTLLPSHKELVDKIGVLWQVQASHHTPALIQLCGPEIEDKTGIAQAVSRRLDRQVKCLNGQQIPLNVDDLALYTRRLERECLLEHSILLLNCDDVDYSEQNQRAALQQLLVGLTGFTMMTTRLPLQGGKPEMIRFDVPRPDPQEQLLAWQTSVTALKAELNGYGECLPAPEQLSEDLQGLTAQFQLSASMIRQACIAAVGPLTTQANLSFKQVLWQSCRIQARPGLDELAERIESKMTWDDLVLPPLQKETLKEISTHVQQRATVYETWGFAAKNRRGLGITALFSGPSGTGKTMAAGVLANELELDLYKIELSSVVSKYIGETEKNLQRIFDAAESGGAILLFDEADSIFGKRSEVKDSKDRYANLEVSYLLQRMESYPGLAILTTNLQSNLDPAFMRRLRFVTQFALPDAAHRAEIWRRVFPKTAPTQGLNHERLAQLNAPGGNIRIIALNAAFIAADAGEPIQMKHILRATQTEYEKLGKSLTSVEIADWVEELARI